MSPVAIAGIALLIVAVVLANAPFFTEKYFFLKAPKAKPSATEFAQKGLGFRFFELLVYYLITLGVGLLIENRLGQVHTQGWQFYAITVCLFLVLAFPGFVVRYLKR
jgi:hypothetical protein